MHREEVRKNENGEQQAGFEKLSRRKHRGCKRRRRDAKIAPDGAKRNPGLTGPKKNSEPRRGGTIKL
jgi:hypothetical protein